MTTICAVQGNGWGLMGWDARITEDSSRVYATGSQKVIRTGAYLIGVAGDVRAINILSHAFRPPRPIDGLHLDRFITRSFIPAVRQVFDSEGYMAGIRDKPEEHGAEMIVIVHGVVYQIGGDWAWVRDEDGLYSIGSGGDYALGAMSLGDYSTPAKARQSVLRALAVAGRYDWATGAPYRTRIQTALT